MVSFLGFYPTGVFFARQEKLKTALNLEQNIPRYGKVVTFAFHAKIR